MPGVCPGFVWASDMQKKKQFFSRWNNDSHGSLSVSSRKWLPPPSPFSTLNFFKNKLLLVGFSVLICPPPLTSCLETKENYAYLLLHSGVVLTQNIRFNQTNQRYFYPVTSLSHSPEWRCCSGIKKNLGGLCVCKNSSKYSMILLILFGFNVDDTSLVWLLGSTGMTEAGMSKLAVL